MTIAATPSFVEPSIDDQPPGPPPDSPTLPGAPVDPEAPYGRKPDGTPWKMSPEQRAEMGRRLAEGRQRAASSGGRKRPSRGGRSAPATRKPATPPPPSYATMAAGILQIPAMVLGIASRWWPTLGLDALAISYHTPPISQAIGQICEEDARWAMVIEKVGSAGPYAALALPLMQLGMQIAANHQMIPPNPDAGVLAPDELMDKVGVGGPTDS